MSLPNNLNHIMFYQDDLAVSYRDFLLLSKYYEEQIFESINPLKVVIVIPDGLTGACLLLYCLQKYTVLPLTTKYLASEYELILKDFAPDLVIVCKSDNYSQVENTCSVLNTKLLAVDGLTSDKLDKILTTYRNTYVSLDFFNLNLGKLVLFTSGTTGKPKQVYLSWVNILASIANIRTSYNLTEEDICLNVMPLYHIHGIIACLLSSIYSGGSIILLKDGFNVISFFNQLFALSPSWYSAVPTIHQSICNRILSKYAGLIKHTLRFIRSSSSALSNKVYNDLFTLFNVPVYQAYGMTEACHQIATQLPTCNSPIGSVGFGKNVLIRIRDDMDKDQDINSKGIVWIKGLNIFEHYEGLSRTKSGFSADGYFNTGDIGYLDTSGALTIVSRLKEMINKGGEKIAPKEIEDIILAHPSVDNAVCFSTTDAYYGENIGLAILLKKDKILFGKAVIEYIGKFLNDFKIPQEIYFVEEIPKGTTGKLQRIGLAQILKDLKIIPYNSSQEIGKSNLSKDFMLINTITYVWENVLQISPVKDNDDFFILGGDSILAAKMVTELTKQINNIKNLSIADIFRYRSIRQLSDYINYEYDKNNHLIKLINEANLSNLLFLIHPGMGGCEVYFGLANSLVSHYKCYGIDNYNIHNHKQISNLYDLANLYLLNIEKVRLQNKIKSSAAYNLSGWSLGGRIALAIATILEKKGVTNINIFCIDTILNDNDKKIVHMRNDIMSKHREKFHLHAKERYRDEEYAKNVVRAMDTEELLSVELIEYKLKKTRIVLFKAIQIDETKLAADIFEISDYVLQLPNNNLASIIASSTQLKVITLDCHHYNVMEKFNEIAAKIILLSESD